MAGKGNEAMTLEMLLLLSLGVNLITLIISFYTLRRYKKILQLSNLIYDKLIIARSLPDDLEAANFDFKSSFTKHLKLNELELEQAANKLDEDPLLVVTETAPQEENPTNKIMTKAESHLVKVLQAKYSLNDDKDPQPAGS